QPYSPVPWTDPRTQPGELLWPEGIPPDEVAKQKLTLGPHFSVIFNQEQTANEDNLFKREHLQTYYTETPNAYLLGGKTVDKGSCITMAVCDPAISEKKTSDYTA